MGVVRLGAKEEKKWRRKLAKMGAQAAAEVLTPADRKKFGSMGGRPADPRIKRLMKRHGLSRQAAWYRLNRATGKRRGRPKGAKNKKKAATE